MALKVRDVLRGLGKMDKINLDGIVYVKTPDGAIVGVIDVYNDAEDDLILEIPEH